MKKLFVLMILLMVPTDANAWGGCGPKPAAWCGWWLRCEMWSDPGKSFNRALEWVKYGHRAPGPAPGVIVVWAKGHGRGHVGKITAPVDPARKIWMVKSGNDQGAVRERPRSVAGAYAFRWP